MSTADKHNLIQVILRFSQQATVEAAEFQQRVADKLHIHPTDLKALLILASESPLAAGKLGNKLKISPGAVTGVVGRLEKAQLATRIIDAADKRKVSIQLNEKGVQQVERLYKRMGEETVNLLSTYTEEELRVLCSYFEKTIALVQAQQT